MPDLSTKYTFTNEDNGAIAVFNDPANANFVGYLKGIEGLDSAPIQGSSDTVAEGDGTIYGDSFYRGRVLAVSFVISPDSFEERMGREQKLKAVADCLRPTLGVKMVWTPKETTTIQRYIGGLRLTDGAPLKIGPGRAPEGLLTLACPWPNIYSNTVTSGTLAHNATHPTVNRGNAEAEPYFEIRATGAVAAGNHLIINQTQGYTITVALPALVNTDIHKLQTRRPDRYLVKGTTSHWEYLSYPYNFFTLKNNDVLKYQSPGGDTDVGLYYEYRETWS